MRKKTAYLGLLTAAAMILGYVESLVPVFAGVPGMKLGLPNLAIVMVLYLYSWKEALAVSVVRILGIGLLFGNLFSIAFSMAGGVLSLLCMELARKYLKLGCVGVSMVGGVAHNAGQIAVAAVVVENMRITYYFPVLAVSGTAAGILIGVLGGEMVRRMSGILPAAFPSGQAKIRTADESGGRPSDRETEEKGKRPAGEERTGNRNSPGGPEKSGGRNAVKYGKPPLSGNWKKKEGSARTDRTEDRRDGE